MDDVGNKELKEKKSDRRVNRTRRALREALLELIHQKGYHQVTVEELTDLANVGRTTFYLHYRDKEDLLLEHISELIDGRVDQLAQIPLSAWRLQGQDGSAPAVGPLLLVFQHVLENADLYRIVLKGEGTFQVAERLRGILSRSVNAFLLRKMETDALQFSPEVPVGYLSSYFAGALLGSITWWLDQGLQAGPQEMARMFQRMFFPGARDALGLGDE